MKKLLALALATAVSLPVMAAETTPTSAVKPGAESKLGLNTPIAGNVTVGTGLAVGAAAVAVAVAATNSGGGGNDSTPGTTGPSGTTGTTGTTGTN